MSAHTDMPVWRLSIYALPALPLAFLYVPLTTLLPAFYTQTLGLSLSAVGGFMLASRLFDVVIDPILGRWSDTTRTRFGRRKPFMVLGTPIFMIGAWMVFMPPEGATGWYLLSATAVIYFGASMLGLAYSAWGAEIVGTYHGRSRLAGFREAANVLGIVAAASIPAITSQFGYGGVSRETMRVMGWVVIIAAPLTVWAALKWIPEPDAPTQTAAPWFSSIVTLLKNRPFRLLCIGFMVLNIGASITNTTLIFYLTHYIRQDEVIGPTLLASFGSVLVGVPIWVWISRRMGKHRAAGYSLFVAISLEVIIGPMFGPGDGWLFVALMAVLGITSAAFLTLPLGIVGDIIDYDTLKTGQSRGGLFFGVWAFFLYISPAIAIGITLPALEFFGFNANAQNTPQALEALKYIFFFAPAPFFLAGAIALLYFPIDARRHGIIRRRLDSLRSRAQPMPILTETAPAAHAKPAEQT